MICASLAAVGVMIALGQVFVVGPAVARFGERDAATLGILVAVAVYIAYAFTTSTIGAFLLLIPVALQAPVQPSLLAMMRSEERRVGKEWVSPCRSRGSPSP